MLRLSRFFFGYHLKKPYIFTRGYSSLGNAKGRPESPSTKENEARVVPDPPGRRAPDGTCFILLVPTHPCYHPSHATISAASSSMGFPLRALGCGVWTQMLWSFLKLLLRCFKVLLAHLWLSQCVCCINKSRSSNREDVSNLNFINRKSSLLRAWAFRLRGQGLSLASTTYLIDQVNFSEPQCYSLYMCPPHPIFICRSPNRQSDDICWWSHWEVISFRWGYFFFLFSSSR